MNYATVEQIEAGFRELTESEKQVCEALAEEAGMVIDSYNVMADYDAKRLVTCRMVRRAIGNADALQMPMGATQGSVSALGYSQSFTMQNGSVGELYLSKTEKKLLGIGAKIGARSPLEGLGQCEG